MTYSVPALEPSATNYFHNKQAFGLKIMTLSLHKWHITFNTKSTNDSSHVKSFTEMKSSHDLLKIASKLLYWLCAQTEMTSSKLSITFPPDIYWEACWENAKTGIVNNGVLIENTAGGESGPTSCVCNWQRWVRALQLAVNLREAPGRLTAWGRWRAERQAHP